MSNGAQNARSSAHHAIAGRAELFNVVDAGKRMRPADGNAVVAVLAVDDAGKAAGNCTDRVGVTAQIDGLEDGIDVVVGVDEAPEGRHEDVGDEAGVRHGYPGITIKFTEANIHEETASLAKGYEAICAFVNADLSTPVIEELNAQGVKLILMRCAGYNNVDLETAHKFGMKVLRVPGYSPEAVAEHAMALALTANRHTHKAYIKCRENNFSLSGLMGLNFYQKTAGIIGTGKIGQAMAKICKGFGMRVIAYDLFPNKSLDYLEYVSLDELLATSDLISLHCPLTEETKHIINEETIAKMKDGVILVNTSRGGLIKTEDLISGIRDHKFFAVGLDVYEEETDFVFEDMSERILQSSITQRLLSFPNVVMTSHQGFFTKEALTNIAETTLENAKAFMDRNELKNEVLS